MASRCINALNELDAISDKVFYKYSKNRLKQDIEKKVRESKSRAERISSSTSRAEKSPSRKSVHSVRSSTATVKNSNNLAKSAANNSTCVTNTLKRSLSKNRDNVTLTKNIKCSLSEATTISKTRSEQEVQITVVKSPSVFGKYTPGAPKNRTGKWFNFEDGVNQGAIDSFVCDDLNERAICYKVDGKDSKSVPKLLRHRLEVRIGQNGKVRTQNTGTRQDNQSADSSQAKGVRTLPLSWEEQLNWENASIKRPRTPQQPTNGTEGLCETHPVIFNQETNYPRLSNTTAISNKASMSYHLYMDKKLVSDRRNLTCGLKCVTSVELEESASNPHKGEKGSILRTKSEDSDVMDMSSTIQNIGKIYRTYSEELTKKGTCEVQEQKEGHVDAKSMVESTANKQENPEIEKTNKQELEKVKLNKKVSFRDNVETANVVNSKTPKEENFTLIKENPKGVVAVKRPSSSRVRSTSITFEDLKLDRPKRPYTAPPSSPRVTLELQGGGEKEESTSASPKQLLPIWVPTSNEIHSETENELKESREEFNLNSQDTQVKFSCKSAPTVRSTHQETETLSLARSQSTTSTRVKTEKYVPPKPVAVLDNSDPLELPANMAPGQALIELRKKIRENLAKETADLQLDIQQLYLKHHSYNN